jgi:hypothetical protein
MMGLIVAEIAQTDKVRKIIHDPSARRVDTWKGWLSEPLNMD